MTRHAWWALGGAAQAMDWRCLCPCGRLEDPPEFADAADYLTAQVRQIFGDPVVPGLANQSAATLVYGSAKFRHMDGVHGRSYAAQVTLDTLEGKQLMVELDGSGLRLLNAGPQFSEHRYHDISDVLADHSPAYVAAFREANGVAPIVQWWRQAVSCFVF